MPKLFLKGIFQPVTVSNDEAELLARAVRENIKTIELSVGFIKTDAIKIVTYDHEPNFDNKRIGEYDLDDPAKRRIITDFEKTLNSYQPARPQEIEHYGQPFKNFKHLQGKPELAKWVNYVKNDLLGGCPWNWVAYALDMNFLKQGWAWVDRPDLNDFLFKIRAIKELQSRRAYVDQKKNEEVRQMITEKSKEIDVSKLFL